MQAKVGEYVLVRATRVVMLYKYKHQVRCARGIVDVMTRPLFESNGMGVYRTEVKGYADGVYVVKDFDNSGRLVRVPEEELVDPDEFLCMMLVSRARKGEKEEAKAGEEDEEKANEREKADLDEEKADQKEAEASESEEAAETWWFDTIQEFVDPSIPEASYRYVVEKKLGSGSWAKTFELSAGKGEATYKKSAKKLMRHLLEPYSPTLLDSFAVLQFTLLVKGNVFLKVFLAKEESKAKKEGEVRKEKGEEKKK